MCHGGVVYVFCRLQFATKTPLPLLSSSVISATLFTDAMAKSGRPAARENAELSEKHAAITLFSLLHPLHTHSPLLQLYSAGSLKVHRSLGPDKKKKINRYRPAVWGRK